MADQQFDHATEISNMIKVMPPQMKQAFQKVVLAGQHLMYSPETRDIIKQVISAGDQMGEILGHGIANLVVMIDNKAQGNLPKDVLIPAATVLLFDAADALKKMGATISVKEMGDAYEMMFYNIFKSYGIEAGQVDQVMDGMAAKHAAPQGMLAQAGA